MTSTLSTDNPSRLHGVGCLAQLKVRFYIISSRPAIDRPSLSSLSPTMLGAASAIVLCILPLQVIGLITTSAKCLAGYNWMFSSIGQSPCDVAAELASVCVDKPYNWDPLPSGVVYPGPDLANQTSCMCNSVTYSLLSACAHCQGRDYIQWSNYSTNCTVIFSTVFTNQIPVGVKVPAYAYQDVSISNTFNVTLAQSTTGTESSRLPPSSTRTPTSSSIGDSVVNDTPSIVGGVVGGLVALGLIAALITFIVVRAKGGQKSPYRNQASPRSPDMAITPKAPASRIRSTRSPPPSSRARANKASSNNDRTTRRKKDPNQHHSSSLATSDNRTRRTKDPNRQPSPSINRHATPDLTENTPIAQNDVPPQMPEKTGGDVDDAAKSEL